MFYYHNLILRFTTSDYFYEVIASLMLETEGRTRRLLIFDNIVFDNYIVYFYKNNV